MNTNILNGRMNYILFSERFDEPFFTVGCISRAIRYVCV